MAATTHPLPAAVFCAALAFAVPARAQTLELLYTMPETPTAVAAVDDLDGDGFPDILVGHGRIPSSSLANVFLYSGRDGTHFGTLLGQVLNDGFGTSSSDLADFDGDGTREFAVFASRGGAAMGGSLSIFSGRSWALLQRLEFTPQETSSGIDFGPAGDQNGDGFPDLILGFPGDDRNGPDSGTVEILSGKSGKVLFRKSGQSGSFFGHAVSGVGDLNGDGRDDFMVVAPWNSFSSNPGSVLFFSGRTERLIRSLDGTLPGQGFGSRAAVLGDTNGDGVTDVIVGEPGQDIGDTDTGLVQIFSGADGSILLFLPGGGRRHELGMTVERTGDVDRDGFADFFAVSQNEHFRLFKKIFSGRDAHVIYDFSDPSAPSRSLIPGGDFDLDGHPDFLDPGIRFSSHSLGLSVFKSDLPVKLGNPDPGLAGVVNTLTVTGLHPFARATLVAGFRPGSSFLPCFNGTRHIDVHILPMRLRVDRTADARGVARLSKMVPASLSRREVRIRALEFERCRLSNLVVFPFP